VAEHRPLPGNLRLGLALLALLGLVGIAAPVLATERPWIARDASGYSFPAWRSLLPGSAPAASVEARAVLRAPIPHGPNEIDLRATLRPPGARHLLGTDDLGRDLAARIVHGARVSLAVGLLSALLAVGIGVPLGAWAGYRRGWADFLVSRVIEAGLSFPTLLLVLAVLSVASQRLSGLSDVSRIAVVLGLTGWMPIARYLRAEYLRLRESEMVAAARAIGSGHLRIVSRHILPSALAPVLVTAAFAVGAAIGTEAALSFLGLGIHPPQATWGVLLSDSREQIERAWWLACFPGAALFAAIVACNFVGEGLRDLLDPRTRRR